MLISCFSVVCIYRAIASDEVNCFICGDILQESEVIEVKEKGLETFRQSSIKRKDNKYKLLVGLKSIVVHDACRKRYNNEKLIAAALRRGSDGTTSQVQLRSTRPTFSCKNHCFLCAAEITAEFISKQKQTRLCEHDIEEEETDTMLEQINDAIENEEDHDETDDPIVDDAKETSVFDISIGIEDDENQTPGPSTRMKRRKLN
ncbi:hypothetical protein JTB14_026234 [Gonioctena quinquepunctata]|nr:hypothetical protein JTB14_026234 [Gonioctena quinquepunctata]